MAGRKVAHLNEVIRQKLGTILQRQASDPRFALVTITDVRLAKDQSIAQVMYSTFATHEGEVDPTELTEALNRAAGFLSQAVGRTLNSRRTPRLHFEHDPGFDYSAEMDIILKKLHEPND